MILAASTQRTFGVVILVIGLGAVVAYWLFNWVWGRQDIGSEIELAANRKPYLDDAELETNRLDQSLTLGLATLAVIGVALPLYWLGEPGRQEGYVDFTVGQFASRGEELYVEACSRCHGPEAVGGVAPFTVLDDNGAFVAQASWDAPALNNVFYRYSEEEILYVLNFGRQNSPMPAWGAPGGGPLTSQQLDDILIYLTEIQLTQDEVEAEVAEGVDQAARVKITELEPDLGAARATLLETLSSEAATAEQRETATAALQELDAEIEELAVAYVASAEPAQLGELLFNNRAGQGSYSCARCHTSGWSWNSDALAFDPDFDNAALITPQVSGGGGFGPNLTNGATHRQFDTLEEQVGFIILGAVDGMAYGNFGQGDGGGQMPAFGVCVGDRDSGDFSPIRGVCEDREGMLTTEQIEAVVAYERGL